MINQNFRIGSTLKGWSKKDGDCYEGKRGLVNRNKMLIYEMPLELTFSVENYGHCNQIQEPRFEKLHFSNSIIS